MEEHSREETVAAEKRGTGQVQLGDQLAKFGSGSDLQSRMTLRPDLREWVSQVAGN